MKVETPYLKQRYPDINPPDVEFLEPKERPLGGLIEYTTLPKALAQYQEDPFGEKKIKFLQEAFGIDDVEAFLIDAGLAEYIEAKRRGSMVSAVKSHYRTGTPYNYTDVMMSGGLAQMFGIPTATLSMQYSSDILHTSEEKMEGFGKQPYFVGYNPKGAPQFAQISIKPIGIRDGSMPRGMRKIQTINDASGSPLKDIFVEITDPVDPRGAKAAKRFVGTETEYPEAVLGIRWRDLLDDQEVMSQNPGKISVTQLHTVLFELTIDRLRKQGYLPGEDQMAVIYTDLGQETAALLKHANRVEKTLEILGFTGKPQKILSELLLVKPNVIDLVQKFLNGEASNDVNEVTVSDAIKQHHKLLTDEEIEVINALPDETAEQIKSFIMEAQGLFFDEKSGLLCRRSNDGVSVDPASYYPMLSALLDNDHTSLDEPSAFFTQKVVRSQNLFRSLGLPISVIRTPHTEIPAIDTARIHPTGVFTDLKGLEAQIEDNHGKSVRAELTQMLGDLFTDEKKPPKPVLDASSGLVSLVKATFFNEELDKMRKSIQEGIRYKQQVETDALVPDEVLGWWIQMLMSTVPQEAEV